MAEVCSQKVLEKGRLFDHYSLGSKAWDHDTRRIPDHCSFSSVAHGGQSRYLLWT